MARVTWEVDDGYCGKSRPQHTEVPDEELEACETQLEKRQLIREYVQADFDDRIVWYIQSTEGMDLGNG